MTLVQISILLLVYFLFFTFFKRLTFTSTGIFLCISCSPNDYVAVHSCPCSDNCFLDPNVVPQRHTYSYLNLKLWNLVLYFGRGNAITTGVIIVITLLNVLVYKLRQLQEGSLGQKSNSSVLSAEQVFRRFSLAEIKLATHSFDEAFLIGKGGFGKVYKGIIDDHGAGETTVAIKRLDSRSKQGASEFWTEINILSRFRHCHLVSLIGYCDEFQEMILVYEYVPSGNLSDHLHRVGRSDGDAPLSWVQRLKICIGAARALDYLHTVHGGAMKKKSNNKSILESGALLPNKDGGVIKEVPLSAQTAALNLKVFTFSELENSTMNFSKLLGKGGFGSVFMGWVDAKTYTPSKVDLGMPVAVKKLDKNGFQGHNEWQVNLLSSLNSLV